MFQCYRPLSWARMPLVLLILLAMPFKALATDNLWINTFGQQWFYEARSYAGQVLAGTWWESSLTPGSTYRMSFEVRSLQGELGVYLGGDTPVTIDSPGQYSFDFSIAEGGKRRLIFRAASQDVVAGVGEISVAEVGNDRQAHWGPAPSTGGTVDGAAPKGHYLTFARERNLKTEVLDLMDDPDAAPSNYHLRIARDLDAALRTPGVKGFAIDVDWRTVETGDGVYDWRLVDDNMEVARRYGLKFIVKISDRSFDGTNIMPRYFPSRYVLWTTGGGKTGFVSKRWDPYVYERMIRLYKRIAWRYASHAGFGGIATTETALGSFSSGDYTLNKYLTALTQIANQTQSALNGGKLFFYLNFLKGGDSSDMNRDARVRLLKNISHDKLVAGAPDITPDVRGMPGSVSSYRVHVRKNLPSAQQFCHLQHVDQGLAGINVKSNKYRKAYLDKVANVRERESQSWFSGEPSVFEFDDLRDPQGRKVDLHPSWVLGQLWKPAELFAFGERNFNCDYFFWHYREHADWDEFDWDDVEPVILNNPYFYQ